MNALLAVVLVCAATTGPADCTRETALDVVSQPATSEIHCLQVGQFLAAHSFAEDLRDGRWLRVNCERRKAAAADAPR